MNTYEILAQMQEPGGYVSQPPDLFNFVSFDSELKRFLISTFNRDYAYYEAVNLINFENGYISDLCGVYDSNQKLFKESA